MKAELERFLGPGATMRRVERVRRPLRYGTSMV